MTVYTSLDAGDTASSTLCGVRCWEHGLTSLLERPASIIDSDAPSVSPALEKTCWLCKKRYDATSVAIDPTTPNSIVRQAEPTNHTRHSRRGGLDVISCSSRKTSLIPNYIPGTPYELSKQRNDNSTGRCMSANMSSVRAACSSTLFCMISIQSYLGNGAPTVPV